METPSQPAFGYAVRDKSDHLSPFSFTRRTTGPDDVSLKVAYCGICHSDWHMIRNDWGVSMYPMVPGHEIVGIVTDLGSNVKRFKQGDHVGVGCIVRSCAQRDDCNACKMYLEQFCPKAIWTYGAVDVDGTPTYGGYSNMVVVNQSFVFRIPDNLPLDAAAPLLCAGITVYSPMKAFNMSGSDKHLGVVGLGGLGHMAVKFGKAFDMEVTVISTSPQKEKQAKELLGADHFLNSKDPDQMKNASQTIDFIIDTVSASHPLEPLLSLLRINGKLVLVGLPAQPMPISAGSVIFGRRSITGTSIGGTVETQEMLDFCGEKNITATIEKIPIDYVNTAMERMVEADVKYRFVIDIEGTLKAE